MIYDIYDHIYTYIIIYSNYYLPILFPMLILFYSRLPLSIYLCRSFVFKVYVKTFPRTFFSAKMPV